MKNLWRDLWQRSGTSKVGRESAAHPAANRAKRTEGGMRLTAFPPYAVLMLCALLAPMSAQANDDFPAWLAAFRVDAAKAGISAATLDAALSNAQPIARVIELDRRQPEFLQTFLNYLNRRVTPQQVERGQRLLDEHAALFDAVEAKYGVPKTVLAAFWAMETNYGRTLGSFNIPMSLATLAWEGRRSGFFRGELMNALRIVDAGHVLPSAMVGSWAGAMGQMQFMPSTFRAYAVDGDGDGRIDLWGSLPDALFSAGNYLRQAGWQAGEAAAFEVRLPAGFDPRQARVSSRKPVVDWSAAGVAPVGAPHAPKPATRAAVVLPQGWQGPAFYVFENFDTIMRWNRSVNYALSVAQLANQLGGGAAISAGGGEAGALSTTQVMAMQQLLNELGFDAGSADGMIGPRTQSALRQFQARHALPVDGYPAPSVFAAIDAAHALAKQHGTLKTGANLPTFSDLN
jgi:membrane-bound lytic murein transglycosylase B